MNATKAPTRTYPLEAREYAGIINPLACADCGMPFGIDKEFEDRRREDHRTFYCPNGHPQSYGQRTEAEREKSRRINAEAELEHAREQRDYQKKQAASAKGQKTRIMNLIKAGVCPVCRERNFTNVRRHMETQHPDEE